MNAIYSPALNTGTSPTVAADHLDRANKIFHAGHALLSFLKHGQKIGSAELRNVLINSFGGSDAEGRRSVEMEGETRLNLQAGAALCREQRVPEISENSLVLKHPQQKSGSSYAGRLRLEVQQSDDAEANRRRKLAAQHRECRGVTNWNWEHFPVPLHGPRQDQ